MKKNNSSKESTKSLFDHINAIYTDQRIDYFTNLSDADKKSYSIYMVNRFLSMNPLQLPFVNEIQKYNLSPDIHYLFFSQLVPRGKQFNKYIKGAKEKTYEQWMIELVSKHYEVSSAEAIEYIDMLYRLNKKELRELLELYGIDSKTLKKVKL